MKKMLWSKLPKKDKKHLRENKIFTKYLFEQQILYLKSVKAEHPISSCYECIQIAKKLGMWEN